MTRRFFSGSSLQQAVMRAARHYAIDPDEVEFNELNKRHGFLRIRRKVVIEIDPENPKRSVPAAGEPKSAEPTPKAAAEPSEAPRPDPPKAAPPPPEVAATEAPVPVPEPTPTPMPTPAPKAPPTAAAGGDESPRREPQAAGATDDDLLVGLPDRPRPVRERYPEATGATALAAEKALQVALRVLAMEVRIDVRQGERQLEIELTPLDPSHQSRLLGDDGRVLAALQHLLPRLIRGFIGESVMCRLDCDNYHQIREEQLRDMAQRAADEVKRQGRPYSLKPMPPEDRRVVHLTLEDDSTVKTDSVGDGFFKRVRVRPA